MKMKPWSIFEILNDLDNFKRPEQLLKAMKAKDGLQQAIIRK